MFVLQNAEYVFSDDYLRCVVSMMETLKPFGETPSQLEKSLRQAFVAARTFVQGLALGRNVALEVAKVRVVAIS